MSLIRFLVTTGFPVFLLTPVGAVEPSVKKATDAELQQAVNDPEKFLLTCHAKPGFWREFGTALATNMANQTHYTGGYWVTFASNLGLVGLAAHKAKERYEEFKISEVDSILRAPSFTLFASASTASAGNLRAAGEIKHVVIRRRKTKREDVIQPMNVETDANMFNNLFGAQFVQSTAIVRFDYRQVLDIASRGDVEAVIVTTAGERRCWVDNKKIQKMYGEY